MAYKRKTKDVYELQGNYGQGFELLSAYSTMREAKQGKKEYQQNDCTVIALQIVITREKI